MSIPPTYYTSAAINPRAQLEIIQSSAADPIPSNMVQHIQSSLFVYLFADNIALLNQIATLGDTLSLPPATLTWTRLKEVPSVASRLYCSNTYVAVCTSNPDMHGYSHLIIQEALRQWR